MASPAVAFLANHKLHIRRNNVTKIVESEFERQVRERAASMERRHGWKTQGRSAMFMGGMGAAWGRGPASAQQDTAVLLTGLTRGTGEALLYSMETDAVSGVFRVDSDGFETRLFHTADFRIRHAALDPTGATIAATAFHQQGMRSNILVMPVDGTELLEVTEGDSFDQLPQWVPGPERRLIFQSAGVGRNRAGHFAGLGPCTVQELNLDSGSLTEIAAESDKDLLQPRRTTDGAIYYIRKPYESGVHAGNLLSSLKDALLFPFRMAVAIFQYFNFFSMLYSGKPLVTKKGAVQKNLDPRTLFMYGNLAQAQQQVNSEDDSLPGSAPSSWELVRQLPGERPKVLASRVLSFDIAADGAILYSSGVAIHRLMPDGSSEPILEADLIEHVLAL